MLKKISYSVIMSLILATFAQAQDIPADALAANAKVDGLELPADQTVNYDEGFINIQAKCKGDVKWLIISNQKVKYLVGSQTNSIVISVPPLDKSVVNVFAVGLVDGKLTEFARTNITVNGGNPSPNPNPPGPGPGPGPNPNPNPNTGGPLHVTFFVDLNSTTPELAQILNSQTLRTQITSKGNFFRFYDIKSPIVAQKKLDAVLAKVGGSAVLVIQRNDGVILAAQAVPRTEAEIIGVINKIMGVN